MADRFDKFTKRARDVVSLAQHEARRLRHNYVGTEHLLLGLVREGGGLAAQVLIRMGVDLDEVRRDVEAIIGQGKGVVAGEIGLTPRAKKVIELAVEEARRLNHHYIGTEHLLLGLVREGDGIGADVLKKLGIDLHGVRREVLLALDRVSSTSRTDRFAKASVTALAAAAIAGMIVVVLRRNVSKLLLRE